MILSKQFLNEQVQKRAIFESFHLDGRKELEEYDIFISYSWNDRKFACYIVQLLEKCGYTVYIDFRDLQLNRGNVTEETAKHIVTKMKKCKGLLFLYSPSSSVSKWCPWEVGVFSGIKNFRCANLPLVDNLGDNFKNQEYLEIYPYIDYEIVQNSSRYDFWVCEDDLTYVKLRQWLNGTKPYRHK